MTTEQSKEIYQKYFGGSDPTYLYEGIQAGLRQGTFNSLDEGITWHATRVLGPTEEVRSQRAELAEALKIQLKR